jgi:hypothetical protein
VIWFEKRITDRNPRVISRYDWDSYSVHFIESEKLINLEVDLHKRVIGQNEAVSAIAKAIRRFVLEFKIQIDRLQVYFVVQLELEKQKQKSTAVTMFGAESDTF